MPEPHEGTLNLRDLLGFLWRGAVVAVVLAATSAAATYVFTGRQAPTFRAEATLLVARSTGGMGQFGLTAVTAPPIELNAYRVVATSDQVLRDALVRMGVPSPTLEDVGSLRGRIGTSVEAGVRESSLLRVDARGGTTAHAVDRANAVAAALVAWDQGRARESIDRVIATLTQQIEGLSEQIRSLQAIAEGGDQGQVDGLIRLRAEQQQQLAYARALVASAEGMVAVLQPADTTPRQIAPRPVASAVIAALVAIVATYAFLLLRVALDTRLRGTDDIARVAGLPVLAEFPTAGRGDAKQPRLREASSYLRTNLLFATADVHPKVFMLTSSVENEGKTTIARHLAEGFVRYGYRTLLVDADLRAPSVADGYEIQGSLPEEATTESWLRDPAGPHHFLAVKFTPESHLDVIPQFRSVENASELLGRGFRTVLGRWSEYDVIIIDSPPALAVADPLTIAPHCTGTVLVVDRNRTDRRKLTQTLAALQRVGVRVFGVVANHEAFSGAQGGYGGVYGADPASERHGSVAVGNRAARSRPSGDAR